MAALADDLLLSGDFANSALVLGELRKASERTIAPKAMRAALTTVGESIALREAAFQSGTDLSQADSIDTIVELLTSTKKKAAR